MRHLPYPKVPTADRAGSTATGGPWVATEKVHGANLVVAHDGRAVAVGKRRAWLRPDEPFFGWQLLRRDLEQAARAALARGGTTVRLYGELYGGHYPHPDVPPTHGTSAVQTGVWYSPEIRFALFDVLRHDGPDDPGVFLPYAEVAAVAAAAGLDVVPLLGRGTRTAVDALPVRFPSRLPAALGLPEVPGNLAEGVVLRPDGRLAPGHRPTVKRKIAEFDERRFAGSRPWDPHVRLSPEELAEVAVGMVNGPRLAGARSKVGPDDVAAVLDEVVLDVLVDLSEAYPTAVGALSGDAEGDLHTRIRTAAEDLVREPPPT